MRIFATGATARVEDELDVVINYCIAIMIWLSVGLAAPAVLVAQSFSSAREEADQKQSVPRTPRLRFPSGSLASPSSKAEGAACQQSRVDRI